MTERACPKVEVAVGRGCDWARNRSGKVNASPQAPPSRSSSRRLRRASRRNAGQPLTGAMVRPLESPLVSGTAWVSSTAASERRGLAPPCIPAAVSARSHGGAKPRRLLAALLEASVDGVPELVHAEWFAQERRGALLVQDAGCVPLNQAGAEENGQIGAALAEALQIGGAVLVGNHEVEDDHVHPRRL